jgi:D-alanyl-D-alanine carboxypeptidase
MMNKSSVLSVAQQSLRFEPCIGANVAISDEKYGFWSGSIGYSDLDGHIEMGASRFYIYSITKTFVAAYLLLLMQDGLVDLDEPVTKWLKELPFPETVTLRRLLNHRSGVPNYTSLDNYLPAVRENPSTPWTHQQVMELTCPGQLDFEPGEKFRYSNTGYMLVYEVIEAVTGKTFAEALKSQIFDVLDLKNTYVAHKVDTKGELAPGFSRELNIENRIENVIPRYHPDWCATGLIVSTAEDVVKFFESLFNEKLLNSQSLKEMLTPVPTPTRHPWYGNPCYGLGIMIDPKSKYGTLYGHGGSGPGYNTWTMHLPNFHGRGLTFFFFCNASMLDHPYGMVDDILRLIL